MPKHKSYGSQVKARAKALLEALLAYANYEIEDGESLRVKTRWKEEGCHLVVNTQLRFLEELIARYSAEKKLNKEQIKEILKRFEDFLGILDDNRTKTQGSANCFFTLKLWSRDKETNLREFERRWEELRLEKSKQATGEGADAQFSQTEGEPNPPIESSHPAPFASSEILAAREGETTPARSRLCHNLPARQNLVFIGREQEMARLLELLSPSGRAPAISIEGMGGTGKTTLALEVAYRCWEASREDPNVSNVPPFDAIIFTSAQSEGSIGANLLPHLRRERTLQDIFRVILRVLDRFDNGFPDFEQQLEWVRESLARQRTLLIVDNLEKLEEQEDVLSFLHQIPATVKVILTSRWRLGLGVSIAVDCLPLEDSLSLIAQQARAKGVALNRQQVQSLYQRTRGLPLAMVLAVGQMSVYGILPDGEPTRWSQTLARVARYCFEDSVRPLAGQPAHRLLMALALFARAATADAIARVASSAPREGLAQLHQLSLVVRREERYDLLPITREYVLAELAAYPEFEREARERWLDWYRQLTRLYADREWREWTEYEDIEGEWDNIRAAIAWCIEQDRYEDFSQFWQSVKGYAHLYGYWSDRLAWTDWGLKAAEARSDEAAIARALRDRGWTLVMMGKPEQLAEAEMLLARAWDIRDRADLFFELELAIERAILSLHQQALDAAREWLERSKILLERVQLEASKRRRQSIRIDYYEAEVWFRKGDYAQAKVLYRNALERARTAQWQQVEVYTLNWLASIALEQGNLEEAERLLEYSLPLAQQNRDRRSIAFHKRSRAQLEKLRGNLSEFQRWATEARDGFEHLRMRSEVQQMQAWLDTATKSE